MKVTIELDLTNEQACRATLADVTTMLNVLHPLPVAQGEQVIDEVALVVPPTAVDAEAPTLDFLGEGARKVVSTILDQIKAYGETTLEDVSEVTGYALPTLRAHLANAGRSYKARGLSEPYKAAWFPEQHRVVYRTSDANA